MKLIVCLDDNGGLLFNHRRQSRDAALRADLLEGIGDGPLWLSSYSARPFEPDARLRVDDAFWEKAGAGEWCFAEACPPEGAWERVEELVVYRWNRRYPADVTLAIPPEWKLAASRDFVGTSHERLTREEYVR
ncbi:MAG: ribonuclease Z [Clostridia bacterium]|nr:ribonuclease Z [Clostridia bacterium]